MHTPDFPVMPDGHIAAMDGEGWDNPAWLAAGIVLAMAGMAKPADPMITEKAMARVK